MNNMDIRFTEEENNDIAVIGISCRFPGAKNHREYWDNLIAGKETIRHFSDEELRELGIDQSLIDHPDYIKSQGVLDDIAGFDAQFFGISPMEAEIMDPQHRLFLENAYGALEDAGYDPDQTDARIGIFAGCGLNSYLLRSISDNPQAVLGKGDYLLLTSSDKDFMATRASYKLNLKGPSMGVSTACSTSLVAVELACQSLLSYQSDMVLAGGVTLQVPHFGGYIHEEGGTQSSDGHCRPFDAASSGLVGGSGVGVVVLKRLEDAISDKDNILALIKASAINNDGSNKVGYSSPSVDGQAEVIAEAQANAGVHPETIQYIEAHGTGTRLGDPIEIKALTKAFRAQTDKKGFCRIGSVKSNMGHLDTAAGIAGLIKTVLSLKHAKIPPSLHFKTPNPEIDFANSPFIVNDKLYDWPRAQHPRRAGVSSFGIGGTNAHVILEEAPHMGAKKDKPQAPVILPLSAKTPSALGNLAHNLAIHLENNPDIALDDLAYTLIKGRKTYDYRLGVSCQNIDEAIQRLKLQQVSSQPAGAKKCVFMFPGQGAQYGGMTKDLYQSNIIFRHHIDQCAELLKASCGWDVRDHILGKSQDDITRTDIAQPLLFVAEYALAQLLMAYGVKPDAMIGHSLGEYVCATLAGVFDLEDALYIICQRASLMQSMPQGDMLALAMRADEVHPLLEDDLSIAAINSENRCVVSGSASAIATLIDKLAQIGQEGTLLHTSHAFHSASMDGMLETYAQALANVTLHKPNKPFISNLSANFATQKDVTTPQYWVDHLRKSVRFGEGIQQLVKTGDCLFLEVGPGTTLSSFVKLGTKAQAVSLVRHPKSACDDHIFFLEGVANAWASGLTLDWSVFCQKSAQRISLPTYPFEHVRYWIDPVKNPKSGQSNDMDLRPETDWFYVPSFKRIAPLTNKLTPFAQEPILLFMDDFGLGERLVDLLARTGRQDILTVRRGWRFEIEGPQSYRLRPDNSDDYRKMMDHIQDKRSLPCEIIHLWGIHQDEPSTKDDTQRALDDSYYSLVNLVQSLGLSTEKIRINIITNNSVDVLGNERLIAINATAFGPLRVTGLEHPNIHTFAIDIDIDECPAGDLAPLIMAEVQQDKTGINNGTLVALRHQNRWSQSFEVMPIDPSADAPTLLRDQGAYLIAGGLDGIGLELARFLALNHQAKLALSGTTRLPERDDWDDYLSNHSAEGNNQLSNLSELEVNVMENAIQERLAIKGIESYGDFVPRVNRLCALYICRLFAQSGLDTTIGASYSRQELHDHFAILDKFAKLFNYILKVMEQDGILGRSEDQFTFQKDPKQADNPLPLHRALEKDHPEFKPIFDVFEHCMKDYAKALSGEIEAVGVLFPEGGASIWDKATKAIPEHTRHRVYTELARDLILEKIAKQPNKKLRILELGAGAGVFTDVVLPALKGKNIEYTFTDIGKSFVLKAEKKAREEGLDFMKFGLLDISKDPIAQGYDAEGYDVILELDCVHATSRMRETMAEVRKLLAPNAMVLFVESVVTQRWMNLPLGLLEGWWYFEDEDLREDSPLLRLEKWEELFEECHFKVQTYPQDKTRRSFADSGLIIGEKRDTDALNDPIARKIAAVRELEAIGGEVLELCCDITDKAQMKEAITLCEDKWGQINGFIQTAAFENRGPLMTKTKNAKTEFGPKVFATHHVNDLLGNKGLDFILLSSSHSAYDVGAGDVEYCSSNSYVDAYAAMIKRQSAHTPVMAVNWERWRNVGMAKAYEAMMRKRLGHIPEGGISAAQGRETFRKIMSLDPLPAQIAISICDFNNKIAANDFQFMKVEQSNIQAKTASIHDRPSLLGPYHAPESDMEKQMCEIWQDVLGIAQIGIEDNFYDLGGDSLIAIKVLSRLREAFDVELSVNDLFERPDVKSLCARLELMDWAVAQNPSNDTFVEEGVL